MNKTTRNAAIAVWLFMAAALIFSGGCAKTPRRLDISAIPLYDISDAATAEKLAQFKKGTPADEPFVLKIPTGSMLPVHISVDTPLAKLDSEAGNLRFSQDLYLYFTTEKILASPDGRLWAPFTDMDAVKELFGGDKGMIKMEMSSTKEKGALLSLDIAVTPSS